VSRAPSSGLALRYGFALRRDLSLRLREKALGVGERHAGPDVVQVAGDPPGAACFSRSRVHNHIGGATGPMKPEEGRQSASRPVISRGRRAVLSSFILFTSISDRGAAG
jgi:hypothetical protein